MSTVKRRRRGMREGSSRFLSFGQHEELMIGWNLFAGHKLQRTDEPMQPEPGEFESEEHRAAAWKLHASELLAECDPGSRPWAFFRYELDTAAVRWVDQIRVLMAHNLITPGEAVQIERLHSELRADCSREFFAAVESRKADPEMDDYSRRSTVAHLELIAAWHAWRSRPELAEVFRRRAELVRSAMKQAA